MASKKRTAAQARKDRAAIKRLQKSGTYKGKIDLRKAPTKYQLSKIKELAQRRKAKREPMPPKSDVGGAKITRKKLSRRELEKEPQYRMTTYALPFRRKGREEPEWRRFTWKQLVKFMNEYKGDDPEAGAEWMSYAVRESWVFDNTEQRTEFRNDVDLYFSGRRIDEPHGKIRKQRAKKG